MAGVMLINNVCHGQLEQEENASFQSIDFTLILARALQKNVEHDQNMETRIIAEIQKLVRYFQTIAGKMNLKIKQI